VSPLAVSREDFLRPLFEGAKGKIELRALAPDGRVVGVTFSDVGNGAWREGFLTQHASANIFFGVADRKGASGKLENCLTVGALWVDIDFKTVPEDEARELAMAFAIPPSIALLSGGGAHLYWLLRERIAVGDPDLVRGLLGLARALHADRTVAEPARVLRVPGTKNFKYDPPRDVVITQFHPDRRVALREILRHLPAVPAENADTNGHRFQVPAQIVAGARNDTVYRLGRSLKARGVSADGIAAALRAENAVRCVPPLGAAELDDLVAHVIEQPDRPRPMPPPASTPAAASAEPNPEAEVPFARGLGDFLALEFPPVEAYVEDLLSSEGGGWIGGEEKLGKTYYALDEALCLALALPVAGRFAVPTRRRVLFVEEEDGPRRTQLRLRALLRGHGLDPDDRHVREDLDQWFRLSVWSGFSLDVDSMVKRLDAEIADFRPAVCYLDVLRKLTNRDLNKAAEAGALLGTLDDLRRRYGVLFRVLHHYRKAQGFRVGRGSQEIGGSFVLGAWGESSVFFEPIGRKQGAVRIDIQSKDAPPQPAFTLHIETEGPAGAPERTRLVADVDVPLAEIDDGVFQAVASLPPTEATEGHPGVTVKAIVEALKKADKTVRRALDRLLEAERILVIGTVTRKTKLYGVNDS